MKRLTVTLSALVFMFAMTVIAIADDIPTPTKLDGVRIATSDELKALIGQKDVYIFDMRKALNYGKGHLKGSVSLPFKWTVENEDPGKRRGEFDLSKLPQDKNAKIIFHSDGPHGWKSYYAAKISKEAGYKNVMWYRDGFDDWSKKGYPVEH
ncbi:MAG: rhodanese-like domain-containing protein [Nitrospirae bacterium]|nr:rhodanese-like domain-containing protein [Nitrospirota bacterium]